MEEEDSSQYLKWKKANNKGGNEEQKAGRALEEEPDGEQTAMSLTCHKHNPTYQEPPTQLTTMSDPELRHQPHYQHVVKTPQHCTITSHVVYIKRVIVPGPRYPTDNPPLYHKTVITTIACIRLSPPRP